MKKVCIIGAGAAGLMAAAFLSEKTEISVTLFEKMPRNGIKLSITGKGRCNVTTTTPPERMQEYINHGKKFLKSALFSFPPKSTVEFFENAGVKLKEERGGRIFPVSDSAKDIVTALEKKALKNAEIIRQKVIGIEKKNEVFLVETESGVFWFDNVLIATGGKSYPKTGSTGDGYRFAEKFGHKIIPPTASLVPLCAEEKYCSEMMGLSLKNVGVSFFDESGKKVYTDFGEMLFCHFGISGPVILSASSVLDFEKNKKYRLEIDLKPALAPVTLDKRILRDFEESKNRNFINSLGKLLPAKLIPTVVKISGIDPELKVNSVTKEMRKNLCRILKSFPITVTGLRPIDEAIITSGGVDTSEIDPRRMESKLQKGLFFAGEVIDADALTGGYNLQIAFSTAYLAAKAISEE